ncbi:hypothetical protein RN001_000205 [Aquatica leii]|uniref:Transposase Helix-turn-helix domain-containing protein n=1 Tax=Aquatica leii TaxID=1421715 RepID=A0AAN7SKE1_9COLE|nr:hypothetical protein RN001_000205 [Aquatica leii]
MSQAVTPTERLTLTLRYLATGDSYKSLMYLFRIPANTISTIIPEVCQAIYDVLKDEYLKCSTVSQTSSNNSTFVTFKN